MCAAMVRTVPANLMRVLCNLHGQNSYMSIATLGGLATRAGQPGGRVGGQECTALGPTRCHAVVAEVAGGLDCLTSDGVDQRATTKSESTLAPDEQLRLEVPYLEGRTVCPSRSRAGLAGMR